MRRIFCCLLLLLMFCIPQIAMAGIANAGITKAQPAAQVPVLKVDSAAVKPEVTPQVELTNYRFATHVDAVTGESKLRLVIDTTGPVEIDSALNGSPTPHLNIDIKGSTVGKVSDGALDGKIADDVNFSQVDADTSRVSIELPLMLDDNDYKVFTLPGDVKANKPFRVVVDINKPVPPVAYNYKPGLRGKVITIDPGHGGTDSGAIGPNKTQEKNITLAVALKVQDLLEKAGAKVLMTRQDDRDVYGPNASAVDELKARTSVANNNNADVFLSIHINSFTTPGPTGTATYYYQKTSYDALLAQSIQSSLVAAGGLVNRGVYPARFYVVKRTVMPAALAELGFISNPDEEKLLNTPQFQQQMAQGIVQGLDRFFTLAAQQGGGQ